MFERNVIKSDEPFDAVGHVTTTQSRAANVFDIGVELQRRSGGFADELSAPFSIANLAAVSFTIIHDLNLLDGAVGIQPDRVSDELVFADNFIDDEPTAAAHPPDLLVIFQDAHAARLLDRLFLLTGQLDRSGGKRFAGKDRLLRLIDSQILDGEGRGRDDRRDWQRDKNKFGFHRRLEIESDF
jgi:hypothetical protein